MIDLVKLVLFSYLLGLVGIMGLVLPRIESSLSKSNAMYSRLMGIGILILAGYLILGPKVWSSEEIVFSFVALAFGVYIGVKHYEVGFKLLFVVGAIFLIASLSTVW